MLEAWQDSLRRIGLMWGPFWKNFEEVREESVTELDSTISALRRCAELREVNFNYQLLDHWIRDVENAYRDKLPTLLDAVSNKRYLKVLEFHGVRSDEEYSKGRFKYCVISKVQPHGIYLIQ